jgi:hypothetical protein
MQKHLTVNYGAGGLDAIHCGFIVLVAMCVAEVW